MLKTEYDFLTWTSFPSSGKLTNDEEKLDWSWWPGWVVSGLPVKPGASLTVKLKAKTENTLYSRGITHIGGWDGKVWRWLADLLLPSGTFDWSEYSRTITIPSDIVALQVNVSGGAGSKAKPGITWYDDLKIYQEGIEKPIYENDFGNWTPYIGAGIGIPIGGVAANLLKEPLGPIVSEAVGAGLGALGGGVIGLLTVMGVIPTIPIPTFEEPTPEIPAVGTYQVVG